jgi:hypothetical protein
MTIFKKDGEMPMDSIASYEFHKIFDRVSSRINLQGKTSANAIDRSLAHARENCRRYFREAPNPNIRIRYKGAIMGYNNLLYYRFSDRTMKEATENPGGIVALTLLHGKIEAKRRILAQRQANTRIYKKPQYPRRDYDNR